MIRIHGDRDTVVPLELNSGRVAERYERFGGKMTMEVVSGGGHDGSAHWFQSQALVGVVISRARNE